MAKTFDGPPTLERSGSEHRVGRFPSSSLRFLSPANGGTEGGVKTIEEDRDERWSFLKGKEGRVGFRKKVRKDGYILPISRRVSVPPLTGEPKGS